MHGTPRRKRVISVGDGRHSGKPPALERLRHGATRLKIDDISCFVPGSACRPSGCCSSCGSGPRIPLAERKGATENPLQTQGRVLLYMPSQFLTLVVSRTVPATALSQGCLIAPGHARDFALIDRDPTAVIAADGKQVDFKSSPLPEAGMHRNMADMSCSLMGRQPTSRRAAELAGGAAGGSKPGQWTVEDATTFSKKCDPYEQGGKPLDPSHALELMGTVMLEGGWRRDGQGVAGGEYETNECSTAG